MTTKEKIMELSNNIAIKYAPLHGCENCRGDLHQGCSDECKHEFEVFRSMRDDIKNTLDQIREETIEEVIKYQNGFVRQGNQPGEYELAPEWQVIEDLLNQLKKGDK